MWLRLRLLLLVGLLFAILYTLFSLIGFALGLREIYFYIFMLLLAGILVFIQYLIGPKIVEISMMVRYVSEKEYPELHGMVEELSREAGIPKPRVGVSKLNIPNAFAFGRTKRDARVCVTEGLLNLLNKEELRAVLGHEISHIKHRDVFVITMLSVIPTICYMMYISFFWGGLYSRRRDSGALALVGLTAFLLYLITSLLVMYASRIREYYADYGSVELGNKPSWLATALYKLVYGSARADVVGLPSETLGDRSFGGPHEGAIRREGDRDRPAPLPDLDLYGGGGRPFHVGLEEGRDPPGAADHVFPAGGIGRDGGDA